MSSASRGCLCMEEAGLGCGHRELLTHTKAAVKRKAGVPTSGSSRPAFLQSITYCLPTTHTPAARPGIARVGRRVGPEWALAFSGATGRD